MSEMGVWEFIILVYFPIKLKIFYDEMFSKA